MPCSTFFLAFLTTSILGFEQPDPASAKSPLISLETPPSINPPTASVESSLETGSKQIRQFAFDGDLDTFFESSGNPTASDQFTLRFDRPVALKSVEVATGKPGETANRLESGILQVSTDGTIYAEVARFKEGEAQAALDGPIQCLRIQADKDQEYPLAIREIKLEGVEAPEVFKYPVEFTTDCSDSPEMKPWAESTAKLCEEWYPKLNEALKSEGYEPPTTIKMRITKTYDGVAAAGGNGIIGSSTFFAKHPDDVGAMIHETVHVIQHYRSRRNPGWLVEGVADHVRFFLFEPGKIGPINPKRARYDASYRTTAAFLAYVSDRYDKDLVSKLNAAMRKGEYKEELFKESTGKTVQELGEEWKASLQG